jgi:hypothetical protein
MWQGWVHQPDQLHSCTGNNNVTCEDFSLHFSSPGGYEKILISTLFWINNTYGHLVSLMFEDCHSFTKVKVPDVTQKLCWCTKSGNHGEEKILWELILAQWYNACNQQLRVWRSRFRKQHWTDQTIWYKDNAPTTTELFSCALKTTGSCPGS